MSRFAALLLVLGALVLPACRPQPATAPPPSRREIWQTVQVHAADYTLDPVLVYALIAAESNFDPAARQGEARGLFQLTPGAWRTVTTEPYEPGVWDWRRNLEVGIDYLAWCRHELHRRNQYSSVLVLAAFHYGFDNVAAAGFDPGRLPPPDNPIYRALWRGETPPVPPP